MLPEIEIVYIKNYDLKFKKDEAYLKFLGQKPQKRATRERMQAYIKKIKQKWKTVEKEVLTEMSKITGLKWQEKKIKCYCVMHGKSFSDPLTVRIRLKDDQFITPNQFIDMLTHELAHQIFTQNRPRKAYDIVIKDYLEEPMGVINHIFVHAVHEHIFRTLFTKKRLQEDIDKATRKNAVDYIRAWDIVKDEGYEHILKRFRKEVRAHKKRSQ